MSLQPKLAGLPPEMDEANKNAEVMLFKFSNSCDMLIKSLTFPISPDGRSLLLPPASTVVLDALLSFSSVVAVSGH